MSRRAALTALAGVFATAVIAFAPGADAKPFCLVLGGEGSGSTQAEGLCVDLPIDR